MSAERVGWKSWVGVLSTGQLPGLAKKVPWLALGDPILALGTQNTLFSSCDFWQGRLLGLRVGVCQAKMLTIACSSMSGQG